MLSKKLYVGISFYLDDQCSDIWANGAVQNIIFLYLLLKKLSIVENVSLVFLGNRTTPPKGLMIDDLEIKIESLNDVVDKLDLLIEGTVMIEPIHCELVHNNGGKVVSYRMGNDFIMEMESFVFNKEPGRYFNGCNYDAIWTLPQHENTCFSYFSIVGRAPVYILPHIWEPIFSDKIIEKLKKQKIIFGYQPGSKTKRIASFEANINILKTSYIPILICEQAYRKNPDLIKHIYMCNTFDKKDQKAFHNFIGRTDIVKKNIMTVERRYQMPDFLARYTDIVVAHQWENGLNYAYYDALYGGYPLIHNSTLLPVGYRYDGFNAYSGAEILIDVIEHHDANYEIYREEANSFLTNLSINNTKNIKSHEELILNLFK